MAANVPVTLNVPDSFPGIHLRVRFTAAAKAELFLLASFGIIAGSSLATTLCARLDQGPTVQTERGNENDSGMGGIPGRGRPGSRGLGRG